MDRHVPDVGLKLIHATQCEPLNAIQLRFVASGGHWPHGDSGQCEPGLKDGLCNNPLCQLISAHTNEGPCHISSLYHIGKLEN